MLKYISILIIISTLIMYLYPFIVYEHYAPFLEVIRIIIVEVPLILFFVMFAIKAK